MTTPYFGSVTPLQGLLLSLGGDAEPVLDEPPTEPERVSAMREALRLLRRRTDVDYGYDLRAWHEYLSAQEGELKEEYEFPYAWELVRERILELIDSKERLRLAGLAAAGE